MSAPVLISVLGLVVIGLYGALRPREEPVGWVIGLSHGVLALLALAGALAARDLPFRCGMILLGIYAAAMCANEAIHRARTVRPRQA